MCVVFHMVATMAGCGEGGQEVKALKRAMASTLPVCLHN